MTVCWYYQQGRCRFGENCRYEHPRDTSRRNTQQRGSNHNRFHWVNPGSSSASSDISNRAAAFDFNAALEQARAKELSVWNRGAGDSSNTTWRRRDIQGFHQDAWGQQSNRSSSQGGSYIDYVSEPLGGRGFRAAPREEPRRWGHDRPTSGSAAAFDFNRTLETVRQREAHWHHEEDLDMAPVEELCSESRRPSSSGGALGRPFPATERRSAAVSSGAPQSQLVPSHFEQERQKSGAAFRDATKNDDYKYTPSAELDPADKEQYLAESFTLGKIPVRPPPVEYCR